MSKAITDEDAAMRAPRPRKGFPAKAVSRGRQLAMLAQRFSRSLQARGFYEAADTAASAADYLMSAANEVLASEALEGDPEGWK